MYKCTKWTWVYKYLLETLLSLLFGYIPRSGIVGSYGNSIKFFEELPYLFPRLLHFTFSPMAHKGFNFSASLPTVFFYIVAILMRCIIIYLIVVLFYIPLMITLVEYLFMSLLAICISSLEECLFKFVAHFFLIRLDYFVVVVIYARLLTHFYPPKVLSFDFWGTVSSQLASLFDQFFLPSSWNVDALTKDQEASEFFSIMTATNSEVNN